MRKRSNTKNDSQSSSSLLPLLDDFLLHIQANNYSQETLYNYERDLDTFANFLKFDLSSPSFDSLTKRTIEQYKAYLNSGDRRTAEDGDPLKKLSSGTINRHLTSLRRYLSYLIDMDYQVPVEPSAIKLLRRESDTRRCLNSMS
jgi:site-specific recombinase XerD